MEEDLTNNLTSPILFCFYMNNLFQIMKRKRTVCFIGEYFAGMFGYADDLFLISSSRKGLQEMISTAEMYATNHNINSAQIQILSKERQKEYFLVIQL